MATGENCEVDQMTLPFLANKANELHRLHEESQKKTIEYGIKAGEVLIAAKKKVRHGEWMNWVESNCEFSHKTANVYMWLATNSQRARNLGVQTIRKAIEVLAEPRTEPLRVTYESEETSDDKTWDESEQEENRIESIDDEPVRNRMPVVVSGDSPAFPIQQGVQTRACYRNWVKSLTQIIIEVKEFDGIEGSIYGLNRQEKEFLKNNLDNFCEHARKWMSFIEDSYGQESEVEGSRT